MRLVFWIGFWVFLLDQVSKYIVVHVMELDRVTRIEVWPPFVNFHMAWNTGVNFGLMAGNGDIMRWVLIAGLAVYAQMILGALVRHTGSGAAVGLDV